MVRFDRTQDSFNKKSQREQVKEDRIGKVLQVYEHTEAGDNSNFEADISVDAGTRLERIAPSSKSAGGKIEVPKVGDSVLVGFLAGESETPVIKGYVDTTSDRPPVGKAGMSREEFESGNSPAGSGNLYVTGYTKYDSDPAQIGNSGRSPSETFVQIAKRSDEVADPSEESGIPAKIEFYDAPAKDAGHITIEMNKVDGSDTTDSWGVKVDFKTGEVKLVDPKKTGIVSNGDGDWTWEYNSKNNTQVFGEGSLSL
jgi:hypothetical protein